MLADARTEIGRAVERAVVVAFPDFEPREWSLIEHSPQHCEVCSNALAISLFLDARDGSINSSLSFSSDNLLSSDELEIAALASAVDFEIPPRSSFEGDLDKRVMDEVRLLSSIINKAQILGFNPRELYFFVQGYRQGYTAFASGR